MEVGGAVNLASALHKGHGIDCAYEKLNFMAA